MISINNIKRACDAALARLSTGNDDADEPARVLELVQFFQAPDFYVDNNKLGFYTGERIAACPRHGSST